MGPPKGVGGWCLQSKRATTTWALSHIPINEPIQNFTNAPSFPKMVLSSNPTQSNPHPVGRGPAGPPKGGGWVGNSKRKHQQSNSERESRRWYSKREQPQRYLKRKLRRKRVGLAVWDGWQTRALLICQPIYLSTHPPTRHLAITGSIHQSINAFTSCVVSNPTKSNPDPV